MKTLILVSVLGIFTSCSHMQQTTIGAATQLLGSNRADRSVASKTDCKNAKHIEKLLQDPSVMPEEGCSYIISHEGLQVTDNYYMKGTNQNVLGLRNISDMEYLHTAVYNYGTHTSGFGILDNQAMRSGGTIKKGGKYMFLGFRTHGLQEYQIMIFEKVGEE